MLLGRTDAGMITLGNAALLSRCLAFFCSTKCPGRAILKAYEFTGLVQHSGRVIVSGFHSPVEKDCLEILLRGAGLVVLCPARRLNASRLPNEWQDAIKSGRMLMLSPFDEKQKRATAGLAAARNQFVASIADEVLIAYAHPGSKTEALCRKVLASGKRVYTFNDLANQHLVAMGAIPIEPDHFSGASNAAAGD
jgi:predicted Rossmann fold nucleotide-binding protein DprA/Smf involved in DNA uptake